MATFRSQEYEWSNLSILLLGRFLTGVRSVSYTAQQDKEFVYGAGTAPRAIQAGNLSYEGEMRVLQSELEAMITASPNKNPLSLRFDIVITYADSESTNVVTDLLKFCEIARLPKSLAQGDKFMEVGLPIMFLGIEYQR